MPIRITAAEDERQRGCAMRDADKPRLPRWVKRRNTRPEQMFSALPSNSDIEGVLAPLRWTAKCQRVSRRLAASHSLANLEPLKLRVPEIEWLFVTGLMVCGPECLGFGPCFKDRAVFPDRVRSIKGVIFSFGAFEKGTLYKVWHLVEMTGARQPDVLEGGFASFGDAETVHRDKH